MRFLRGKTKGTDFFHRLSVNREKTSSDWNINYIVKLAYYKLFDRSLNEEEGKDKKLLKGFHKWYNGQTKNIQPGETILNNLVKMLAEKGPVERFNKKRQPIFSPENKYKEKLAKINGQVDYWEQEIQKLKNKIIVPVGRLENTQKELNKTKKKARAFKADVQSLVEEAKRVESTMKIAKRDLPGHMFEFIFYMFGFLILYGIMRKCISGLSVVWRKIGRSSDEKRARSKRSVK